MPRNSIGIAAVIAIGVLTGLSSNAHATCPIELAGDTGGLYGAEAVAASACFVYTTDGGPLVNAASIPLGSGTLAASADLSTGVLTAYSAGGFASAAEWDTFTFSGLPAQGETIALTLTLSGSLTADATGIANILAGPSAGFGLDALTQGAFFGNGAPIPTSISLDLTVTNTSSLTVVGEIEANGASGIADLGDPPTLTIDLPAGVTATSASGVFTNFQPLEAVPEPGTAGLMLTGLGAVIVARRGRERPRTEWLAAGVRAIFIPAGASQALMLSWLKRVLAVRGSRLA